MDSNPKLSSLQVKTGDMTVKKVLSSLKRHGLQHRLKSDITGSRLSVPLQHQPINRTCATDVVEFVVPELDFTPIKDDADDTRTHDDEIRRSTTHSMILGASQKMHKSVSKKNQSCSRLSFDDSICSSWFTLSMLCVTGCSLAEVLVEACSLQQLRLLKMICGIK